MKPKICILTLLTVSIPSILFAQVGWQYQNGNFTISNNNGAIYPLNRDTVFIMADYGRFVKTVNGGEDWVMESIGVEEIFFDIAAFDFDTIYAVGTNGTIVKSVNAGTDWVTLESGTSSHLFSIEIISPDNIWVVGQSGEVLHSVDCGITWQINNSLSDDGLNCVRFSDAENGIILGRHGTLFTTSNGGLDWIEVNIETTFDLFSLTITDNYSYFLAGWISSDFFNNFNYLAEDAFKSNNNELWSSFDVPNPGPGISNMVFANDSVGFTVSSGCITKGDCLIGINKTNSYGENWEISLEDWDPHYEIALGYSKTAFVTDSIGYILCGNTILKTTDGGTFVGIEELDAINCFTVYPNPSNSDHLYLDMKSIETEGLSAAIVDVNGKLLLKSDLNGSAEINISQLPQGVYFIKLLKGQHVLGVEKFVREK